MIKTKSLIRFISNRTNWLRFNYIEKEYLDEIVARLKELDRLKREIKSEQTKLT